MSQNGKGDKPRPKTVSIEKWVKNWTLAFKPKKSKAKKTNA